MYLDIALLFYELKDNEKAMEYLEKAIGTKKNLGEAYEWKGIIEYEN